MKGLLLKAIKEGGDINRKAVYEQLEIEATAKGWSIGSKSSAYGHFQKMNHLLEVYARGGKQALDNVFYIARSYEDLAPFEILVGDQHRFNFWVLDIVSGQYFRPEAYIWQDMNTRLIYGIAVDLHYTSALMGQALRMGLLQFGLFKKTYNDNGKPEQSGYMEQVIDDLSTFHPVENHNIAELYRTKEGYIIEDSEGNPIDTARNQKEWHSKTQRFAKAYNAKAKMIERLNRTVDGMMLNHGVPGLVKNLSGKEPEIKEDEKRIQRLKDENKLFTFEEFLHVLFKVVMKYNHKQIHSALKCTPIEKLLKAHQNGWEPVFVDKDDIDFIFLSRVIRSVQSGKITIKDTTYEGEDLTDGDLKKDLYHLPDKTKVEVRYDPLYPDNAMAILPDKSIRRLKIVEKGSMKNQKLTSDLMARKRRNMKAVIEEYKLLTKPVENKLLQLSKYAPEIKKIEPPKQEKPDYKQLELQAAQLVKNSKPQRARPTFSTKYDRYKWCLDCLLEGEQQNESDRTFMKQCEDNFSSTEKIKWNFYKETKETEDFKH